MSRVDDLILSHQKLVHHEARRLARQLAIEIEECVGAGMIGLVQAAQRFDPARDAKFRTFARWRIRGAIMDQHRKVDTLTRHEREVRKADPDKSRPFHSQREDADLTRVAATDDVTAPSEQLHLKQIAERLLSELPPRHAHIMRRRYYEDATDPMIALDIGTTASRVCQLRREAEALLRDAAQRLGLAKDAF